jgi:hypothetical protein
MPNAIYQAISRVLNPLARLLISQGVSFGQASEMLKAAMVREALQRALDSNDPAGEGGKGGPSDSRLSVATGIHRKEVRRLREQEGMMVGALEGSTASQVLARWLALGSPAPMLERRDSHGQHPSFDDLVTSISKDIRPRAVLDELLARQVVTEEEDGQLKVHADRLVLNQDLASMADYLGMNLADHFSVAVQNLLKEGRPQLDRCVHFHGVSEQMADALHTLAREHAMQALVAVNAVAQEMIKDKKNRGNYRLNFGAYFRKEGQR